MQPGVGADGEAEAGRQAEDARQAEGARRKLLVIGVDAGSPALFRRWTASGDLPNVAALIDRGRACKVENPYALEAGSVWPAFHTGLLPGRQPQYDGRRVFVPDDYSVRWYEAQETAPNAWRQLSDSGLECLLIDPPYTVLDPQINGTMVVDWGTHVPANGHTFDFRTHPPELADEILDLVGPDPTGGVMCDRMGPETVDQHRRFRDLYVKRIELKGRMAAHLLRHRSWDVALVASSDLHCTGHHLWHVNDPRHPRYSARLEAALGEPLRDCYRAFDRSLGVMLEAVDDDTTIMFYGSHGMGPAFSGTGLLDRILLRLDHGHAEGSSRSLKGHLNGLWRRLPEQWRGHAKPLRHLLKGRLRPPRFVGGYQNRRFFEVYANNATGGVRLNLQGREGQGMVDPARADDLLEFLTRELRKIVNTESGEPLVEDVVTARDHYPGPYTDRLPDLLVRWNRSAPIRSVWSPAIGHLDQEAADNRTGDHTPEGICVFAGPDTRSLDNAPSVAVTDLAPTIAWYFGRQLSDHDGRVLSMRRAAQTA